MESFSFFLWALPLIKNSNNIPELKLTLEVQEFNVSCWELREEMLKKDQNDLQYKIDLH